MCVRPNFRRPQRRAHRYCEEVFVRINEQLRSEWLELEKVRRFQQDMVVSLSLAFGCR